MKIEDRTVQNPAPARPPEPPRRPAESRSEVRTPERPPDPEKGRRIDTEA